MKKVFLDGTSNNSIWRFYLKSLLDIDYFDPETDSYSEDELRQPAACDFYLYVITPLTENVPSMDDIINNINKRSEKTVFCFLPIDYKNAKNECGVLTVEFEYKQIKCLQQVGNIVEKNGGKFCKTLEEVANYLNNNY